ncbi:ciliated left-right organizer metallopeptidase isoform X2 [Hyla sarda]|uniref:ciliated left-right organizer metallopeptidase isoform X2 n=1 Tax=Hyla sarda TaxID=327740 RepID=UPI0024C4038A|nr:ciliated left-right organizer metallopeptidase isoform X2 [Hyla sarda]
MKQCLTMVVIRTFGLFFMVKLCSLVCLHDYVQQDTHVVSPPAVIPHKTRIFRRSTTWAPQMPLRVTPWYLPGETALLTPSQSTQLHSAMREVTKIISNMLSVHRSEGPLLLNRDMNKYCRSVWGDPSLPNYKRCGSRDNSYHGERCLDVVIPDSHLYGYEVWPMNGIEPDHVTPSGTGVLDTDFLLYVRVAQTEKCALQPSVIAYAAYCQLDHSGRPIAGVIVFCPKRLKDGIYQHQHVMQVCLHEILHALGFSSSLFERWIDCSFSGHMCSSRSRVTNTDERGQLRIYTPNVMQRMGEHLGAGSVGAPLENQESPASSHWESRIMQGSILTASLSPPHLTFLDPITLAAFQDMGWYGVNTSIHSHLVWGAGVYFGLPSTCQDKLAGFFCGEEGEIGCHYLHLDKGNCSTDAYLDGCRIYKPLIQGGECWLLQEHHVSDEIYHPQSRCFFSNLTKEMKHEKVKGRCYLHRCVAPNIFQIKVQGSEWTDCPAGEWIEVKGYEGILLCPNGRLCLGFDQPPAPTTVPTTTPIYSTFPQITSPGLRVQLTTMQNLNWNTAKKFLTEEVLAVIAQHAGIQRCFLHASTLDKDLSFVLMVGKPNNCHPHPTGSSPHSSIVNLIDNPITYESPHFSTVTIRLLSPGSQNSIFSEVSLIVGCVGVILFCTMILVICWCKHRARVSQVRDIYHAQP